MFFFSLPMSYFLRQLSLPHLSVTVSLTLIFHIQSVAKSQIAGPDLLLLSLLLPPPQPDLIRANSVPSYLARGILTLPA